MTVWPFYCWAQNILSTWDQIACTTAIIFNQKVQQTCCSTVAIIVKSIWLPDKQTDRCRTVSPMCLQAMLSGIKLPPLYKYLKIIISVAAFIPLHNFLFLLRIFLDNLLLLPLKLPLHPFLLPLKFPLQSLLLLLQCSLRFIFSDFQQAFLYERKISIQSFGVNFMTSWLILSGVHNSELNYFVTSTISARFYCFILLFLWSIYLGN